MVYNINKFSDELEHVEQKHPGSVIEKFIHLSGYLKPMVIVFYIMDMTFPNCKLVK